MKIKFTLILFLAVCCGFKAFSFNLQDIFGTFNKNSESAQSAKNLEQAKDKLLESLKVKSNNEVINFLQQKMAIVIPAAIDAHVTILKTLEKIEKNTQNLNNQIPSYQYKAPENQEINKQERANLTQTWEAIKDIFSGQAK